MKVLTEENKSFPMVKVPDTWDDPIHYFVLDYSDRENVDYYCIPMYSVEKFVNPVVELTVGDFTIQMPGSWNVLTGDPVYGDLEVIKFSELNDRDFSAFVFNPVGQPGSQKGFKPHFMPIEITMIYPDIVWRMPIVKSACFIAVPLEQGPNPFCAYFCKDLSKLPDVLDLEKVL